MKNWIRDLFYVPKYGKVSEKKFMQQLTLSVVTILLCMSSMALTAYAYYTADVNTQSNTLKAAHYDLDIVVLDSDNNLTTIDENGKLSAGQYTVTLSLSESTTASTGFCVITIGGETFHTQQIGVDGDDYVPSVTFRLALEQEMAVAFMPHWGTSSYYPQYAKHINDSSYILNEDTVVVAITEDEGGITEEESVNNPTEVTDPTKTTIPELVDGVYTVQAGDTLSIIAGWFDTTVEKIMAYNGLTDRSYITVGQKIAIPPED